MEMAAAAFAALGSAASTGASAIGSTAGAASGLFGGAGSTWLTAMQLGLGGLSAFSQMQVGQEKAAALNAAAADTESQIGNEQMIGQERRASLKRQAAEAMAEKQAAYAAGGVDLSFGTPQTAQAQDTRDAEHALALDQGTENQRIGRLNAKAAEYRASAKSAKSASLMKAFVEGAGTVFSVGKRGAFGG